MANHKAVNSNFLKNLRRHIETFFNNLNTVGHFEHLGIRTLSGLNARLEVHVSLDDHQRSPT